MNKTPKLTKKERDSDKDKITKDKRKHKRKAPLDFVGLSASPTALCPMMPSRPPILHHENSQPNSNNLPQRRERHKSCPTTQPKGRIGIRSHIILNRFRYFQAVILSTRPVQEPIPAFGLPPRSALEQATRKGLITAMHSRSRHWSNVYP